MTPASANLPFGAATQPEPRAPERVAVGRLGRVALIADDLTGALDTAAPFASVEAPLSVPLSGRAAPRGSFALDLGSRAMDEDQAVAAAAASAASLRGAGTAFRKIDSLLRGHPAAEIAATAREGGFASVVVAPAFPKQGRITLQGRQYARHGDDTWHLVACDLMAEIARHGLPIRAAGASTLQGGGAFLCDAEYDSDLAAIVAARPRLKAPVLWCGSSGLARALAGGDPRPLPAPHGAALGIVGTRHAETLAEIEAVRAADEEAVIVIADDRGFATSVAAAEARLATGRSTLLVLSLPPRSSTSALQALAQLAEASRRVKPRLLFASGGDTLAALARATAAERLEVLGEVMPGLPVSRFAGGDWSGCTVLSKSGAFAAPGFLTQLFAQSKETDRGRA